MHAEVRDEACPPTHADGRRRAMLTARARLVRLACKSILSMVSFGLGVVSLRWAADAAAQFLARLLTEESGEQEIEIGGRMCRVEVIDRSGRRVIHAPDGGGQVIVGPNIPDHMVRDMLRIHPGFFPQQKERQQQQQQQQRPRTPTAKRRKRGSGDCSGDQVSS